jgi:hypothetical protein
MSIFPPLRLTLSCLTLITVISSLLLPHQVLAFEASLSSAPSTRLLAPIYLADRDPYLSFAIENLPNYNFSATSGLVASSDPLTRPSALKIAIPQLVAIQPVIIKAIPVAEAPKPAVSRTPLVLEGEASYYSRAGCLGCSPALIMANGQPLRDEALTMAIGAHLKHLVGANARVTNLSNGKSVEVRITDTGGFYQAKYGHRVADLTIGTKQAIGMAGGVGQVRVEVY